MNPETAFPIAAPKPKNIKSDEAYSMKRGNREIQHQVRIAFHWLIYHEDNYYRHPKELILVSLVRKL